METNYQTTKEEFKSNLYHALDEAMEIITGKKKGQGNIEEALALWQSWADENEKENAND